MKPFACDPERSPGRLHEEPESRTRSRFQRDRDRIVHSAAFRRLKHKTQVFVYHEGDHYRTRLTHSLEVSQIARSLSRTLGLNEDLVEALALAHDLGHTPFGHAGERELARCMARFGGFDHNAQALRIVTRLERKYAGFDGLNLTFETLEGVIKHNGPLLDRRKRAIGDYADSGVPAVILDFPWPEPISLSSQAPMEAQIAALADDIAYNAHDLDDGLRANLFTVIDIAETSIVGEALSAVLKRHPDLERPRLIHETVRRVISGMTDDLLGETRRRVGEAQPESAHDIRGHRKPLAGFSREMAARERELKEFLGVHMYRHDLVREKMSRARRIVHDLFDAYMNDAARLPPEWRPDDENGRPRDAGLARKVCDFIAGMTDRYALDEHRRLFDLDPLFR